MTDMYISLLMAGWSVGSATAGVDVMTEGSMLVGIVGITMGGSPIVPVAAVVTAGGLVVMVTSEDAIEETYQTTRIMATTHSLD